jgi:hypothetical protein
MPETNNDFQTLMIGIETMNGVTQERSIVVDV